MNRGVLEPVNIVTYNIHFGMGLDRRIDLERIADAVRDADIVTLQEVERFWKRSGMCDQPGCIARHLKTFHWAYFPAFDVDATERRHDGSVHNRRRQFGPMTLSRSPIRSARRIALPKHPDAGDFNMDTGALECVIDTDHGPIRVYNVHLGVSSRDQAAQIPCLLEFIRGAHDGGGAWSGHRHRPDPMESWSNGETEPPMPAEAIVLGDFNCEPGSEGYRSMVGDGAFVDSWTVARERGFERITWVPPLVARAPGGGMTIDYCFVSPGLGQRIDKAWVDDAAQGSDHRPYRVTLGR